MKFVSDSLSSQEEKCKKFSEQFDIPLEDIYAKADEEYPGILEKECKRIFKKLQNEDPDLVYEDCYEDIKSRSENEARRKSLIRGRSFFKREGAKKQKFKKDGKPCFIIMRFRENDFEPRAYKKIEEFIKKNGEDAARAKGYINSKGEYIHSDFTTIFENQFGKKIYKDNYKSSAIGFFEIKDANGNISYEPRYISISYGRRKNVPIGKPASVIVTESNNAGPLFKDNKMYFYNDGIQDTYDDILSIDLINHIDTLCNKFLDPSRFVDSYDDLVSMSEKLIDENVKYRYAGVKATCMSIGQRDDPESDIPCQFEISDELGNMNTITVWVPVSYFKGMSIIEEQEGILILTDMYYSKDGEIKYFLGGFLPCESQEVI